MLGSLTRVLDVARIVVPLLVSSALTSAGACLAGSPRGSDEVVGRLDEVPVLVALVHAAV